MHNINHWSMDEKCDRKQVLWDIQEVAERDGDGYSGPLKWHDEVPPLKNREEAEKWIQAHDKGWYDDHAVRYYDYGAVKVTKRMEDLKKRGVELNQKLLDFEKEHSVRCFKAEFIGCSNCGSKVAKKYLRSDRCPVCGSDLRSESTLKKIKEYESRIIKARDEFREEQEKQKDGRKVRWLVKFEYHS